MGEGESQERRPSVTTGFWPELPVAMNSINAPGFSAYLDTIEEIMNTKPSIKGATLTFDMEQI
jgi:hypothetical protein